MAVRDFLSAAMRPQGLCYLHVGMREGQASCVRCNAACGMEAMPCDMGEGKICTTTYVMQLLLYGTATDKT